jgi:peptidoglycan/xylan/chitin deacetylase (PgdA/CDA1 family)
MIDALKACKTPQDIGCHTYRHVNAAAPELNDDIVDDELYECGRLARERGIDLRSFVFPFNRVGRLELLARHGYSSYRGANSEWYTRAPAGQHRVFRLARSLLKLTDDWLACTPPVDLPRRVPSGLWMIPHSMFYKGAAPGGRLFIGRLARKAERGMRRAAERRGVFHVWTHPQNLGVRTDKALAGLERIFRVADQHRRSGTLDILSMAQLAERLNQSQRSTVSPPC